MNVRNFAEETCKFFNSYQTSIPKNILGREQSITPIQLEQYLSNLFNAIDIGIKSSQTSWFTIGNGDPINGNNNTVLNAISLDLLRGMQRHVQTCLTQVREWKDATRNEPETLMTLIHRYGGNSTPTEAKCTELKHKINQELAIASTFLKNAADVTSMKASEATKRSMIETGIRTYAGLSEIETEKLFRKTQEIVENLKAAEIAPTTPSHGMR